MFFFSAFFFWWSLDELERERERERRMGGSRVSPTDGREVNRSFPFWWVFFSRFFFSFFLLTKILYQVDETFLNRFVRFGIAKTFFFFFLFCQHSYIHEILLCTIIPRLTIFFTQTHMPLPSVGEKNPRKIGRPSVREVEIR